ncbi:MAG: hypothetical protein MZW92_28295 [Comamonadaceae bacterium]|nr:hypothetical protein [Comamonadaceae bacterium]
MSDRWTSLRAAGRAARSAAAGRADAALGQPGRPADHGPALAERVAAPTSMNAAGLRGPGRAATSQLSIVPALATEWQQIAPLTVALQAAARA